MNERPKNAEQLLALPEGPEFGVAEFGPVAGSGPFKVPVAPQLIAFYSGPDDVLSATDAWGYRWKLGRYSDGRWFRRLCF